ncbi:MAG: phosphodiester glycosidase family protein [Clostridia bacterium]|nr:phosphodiester glycosidase family protein [Clostridia bacterium]
MTNGKKIVLLIIVDVLAFLLLSFAILINVFNWFGVHPVADPVVLTRPSQSPEATTEPVIIETGDSTPGTVQSDAPTSATETPSPTPSGLCGGRFPDRFSYDGVVQTDTGYASENVDVQISYHDIDGVQFQVADILIQDINSFKTWYNGSDMGWTDELAVSSNAIVAVNGDMAINYHSHGWIVRNGLEYHNKKLTSDICILYWNGEMETYDYENDDIDYDAIYAKGPYQIWYFGPELLDNDGQPKTEFNSSVNPKNPRTLIGYYEPGHYALIVVEGRRAGGDSEGYTLAELSQLCYDLGLKVAYNLDGGGSASMWFNNTLFGHRTRQTSDILYIAELPAE